MTNFKQKILAITVVCLLSAGAFAQRRGDDKQRPPKEDRPKVVVQEKPPQNRDNQNRDKGRDKRNDGKRGRG